MNVLPDRFDRKLNHPIWRLSTESLVVPIYQREYKWDIKQVKRLLEDIQSHFESDSCPDFWLGTILLSRSADDLVVIDGQQRILTMFWIFKHILPSFEVYRLESKSANLGLYSENKDFLFKEISNYIQNNKKGTKTKFIRLQKEIQNFKDGLPSEDIERFADYLKNKVQVTILMVSDKYEYFENINSKTVQLTLAEKCLSFLVAGEKYKKPIIEHSREDFVWLTSDRPHKNEGKFKSKLFFGKFYFGILSKVFWHFKW